MLGLGDDDLLIRHDDVTTASGGPSHGGRQLDERTRKLIASILFSRSFILYYQAVLVAIVLVFTAIHQYGRLSRLIRRRRSTSAQLTKDGSAGSSNERSSLLSNKAGPRSTGILGSLRSNVQTFLMYQPAPIPVINKALPDNGTTLVILAFLGINLFFSLYNITFSVDQIIVFADRVSLVFVANLPWLYVLGAKNQPIKLLTGYSYENLNIIHRRLGEWMCFAAVLHAVGTLIFWYNRFRPLGMTLGHFLTRPITLLGTATFICYEILYLTSLASFRQWWYEGFLGTHILFQAGALAFLYFHHPGGKAYVLAAAAVFLIDRLLFRLALKTRNFRADLTIMEDRETVLVSANWPAKSRWQSLLTSIFGFNLRYGWKPTEHMFLSVPAMASKHMIQAHPFTIASAAPEGEQDHAWLNLIVRAHDGFTRDLVRYAETHSSVTIRLDGPYGSLQALEMLQSSDVAIIVAGGSGIAVAYPLLWTLLHSHHKGSEAGHSTKKVSLIWIVHEASHVSWIGHERLDELRELGLHVVIPPPTSKSGRPDIGDLVQDVVEYSTQIVHPRKRVGVVVSGPDSMNRAARNTCADMRRRGMEIDVATEKYSW